MTKYKCGSAKQCQFGEMCKPSYDIGGCNHFKQKKPQTNEEYIKSLNTEQLAEEVYKLVWCSNELFQQMECSGIDTKENDLKIVRGWLKQPHTNKE